MTPTSAQNQAPVTSSRKHRIGLMKIKIGTDHMYRFSDGVTRQVRALNRQRNAKLDVTWKCFNPICAAKIHKSEADLISAHPADEVMEKQFEKHVYGMVHTAAGEKDKPETILLLSDEV